MEVGREFRAKWKELAINCIDAIWQIFLTILKEKNSWAWLRQPSPAIGFYCISANRCQLIRNFLNNFIYYCSLPLHSLTDWRQMNHKFHASIHFEQIPQRWFNFSWNSQYAYFSWFSTLFKRRIECYVSEFVATFAAACYSSFTSYSLDIYSNCLFTTRKIIWLLFYFILSHSERWLSHRWAATDRSAWEWAPLSHAHFQ